jgi:hypothetical protein
MTRIRVDAALRQKLGGLTSEVELCDEAGNVLAKVVPVPEQVIWDPLTPDISEEELQRRIQNPGKYYTTAELLAMMRKP